jgi:chemotaxis protein methyltransferase CheR
VTSAPAFQSAPIVAPPQPEAVRLRDLIYDVAGIFHPDNKIHLLLDRCGRRMKQLHVQTLGEYMRRLNDSARGHAELIALLNEITIGETCFFRNLPQLEAFRRIVVPNILSAKLKTAQRTLRIWSAGCSTGEEPYSLRMLLLEEKNMLLRNWNIELVATDINQRSLAHANAALYDRHSTRNLPAFYRQKYFSLLEDKLQLEAAARANIHFSRLNLWDDGRMSTIRNMDAIFCCNVLIYFDLASKRRVLQHFYRNLLPHGYLFLGQSESLYGVTEDFCLVHLPGTTAYVKRDVALNRVGLVGGDGI